MRKGKEIPMKQWRMEMCRKLQITEGCFRARLYYAKTIPYPKVRRVNKRVVFVQIES